MDKKLYQKIKNYLDGNTTTPEIEQLPTSTKILKQPQITQAQTETPIVLTPLEQKLEVLYKGCYTDNSKAPTISQELGTVKNQQECINLGKTNNVPFVALQNGNQCYAVYNLNVLNKVSRDNCNIVCDENNAGYCGGVLTNQIYATSLTGNVNNELENFVSYDNEIKKINSHISKNDMLCQEPINKYNLLLLLLIIFLMSYMIFETLQK
jgi:hypothetical protein